MRDELSRLYDEMDELEILCKDARKLERFRREAWERENAPTLETDEQIHISRELLMLAS